MSQIMRAEKKEEAVLKGGDNGTQVEDIGGN